MNIREQMSSERGQKDQAPNILLAETIVQNKDQAAVEELVGYLSTQKNAIKHDSIKVLYEIGERKPSLIAGYIDAFVALLTSKNNRLQWGAMTALNYIATVNPTAIFAQLLTILQATDKGSVITRDQAVNILIQLASDPVYASDTFPLLLEQIRLSPPNQVPMYAERAMSVIDVEHKEDFIAVLEDRMADLEKESKRKRVEKVIRKLRK